ncbi:hypothetical protein KY361_05865 [Candidatus Woesearchaeota archaeon]|nr:hypothetical protein [Candidatus Woesearchaeota archaeon]
MRKSRVVRRAAEKVVGPIPKPLEVVVLEVPYIGTYYTSINKKHQTSLPSDLRNIALERQGQERITNCRLYWSMLRSNHLRLTDRLRPRDYPNFKELHVDNQGRVILDYSPSRSYRFAKYVGRGDTIDVYLSRALPRNARHMVGL